MDSWTQWEQHPQRWGLAMFSLYFEVMLLSKARPGSGFLVTPWQNHKGRETENLNPLCLWLDEHEVLYNPMNMWCYTTQQCNWGCERNNKHQLVHIPGCIWSHPLSGWTAVTHGAGSAPLLSIFSLSAIFYWGFILPLRSGWDARRHMEQWTVNRFCLQMLMYSHSVLSLSTGRPQPWWWTDVGTQAEGLLRGNLRSFSISTRLFTFPVIFFCSVLFTLFKDGNAVGWQTLPSCSGSYCHFLAVISRTGIFKETKEARVPKETQIPPWENPD